jgi:putative SOS response-associated peptidase YedK
MGDLRNKVRKLEQEEAHRRWLAEHCPPTPQRPLPRCVCGLTWLETQMVSHQDDRWSQTLYFCPVCFPPQLEEACFGRIMCNLYSVTKSQQAIRDLVKAIRDLAGNMPSLPAIFPNGRAPVVRVAPDGIRELTMMRWGFPPPNIPGSKPRNPYLTNVRNTDSKYWRTYLTKPAQHCLVPVTSFAEPDNSQGPRSIWTWFAQDESRPLMFFAGIWREWEGDRGTKAVPDVGKHLVFSFLTTDASPDVAPIHPDATPVLLLDEESREAWMNAPWELAQSLQKPPPAGALKVVAVDTKQDG